jgi:putative transposase
MNGGLLNHELENQEADWPWSSFHRYVRMGVYPPDWGEKVENTYSDLECRE